MFSYLVHGVFRNVTPMHHTVITIYSSYVAIATCIEDNVYGFILTVDEHQLVLICIILLCNLAVKYQYSL